MKPKKITEKVMLAAVKACADHYVRTELKTGRGFPDCLVRFKGMAFFVEVKAPGDTLKKNQHNFLSKFAPGIGLFVHSGILCFWIYGTREQQETQREFFIACRAVLIKGGYLAS